MDYKKGIIWLITGFTLFRLIYINLFPLLGDEAYYWQWSRHLDFAYYEQGPMTALVIFFFTLFNKINTVFTIRLGAVVLSLLTMIISVLIYRKMYPSDRDSKQSFFNLLFMNSAIIFAVGAILMMHDTVMIFFFALFIYQMLFVLDDPGSDKKWSIAGVLLGLGVISKYTLLAVYPALLLFLITGGLQRKHIKGFLYMTIFLIFTVSPVIFWNLTHDFATVKYLIFRKGDNAAFTLKYLVELLGSQVGLTSIFLFPFFMAALSKALRKRALTPQYMMAMFFVFSFIPFVILSLKNRVEANWPAFCFFPLFFITTPYIFSLKKLSRPLFHSIYAAGLAVILLFQVQLVFPIIPLPAKMDPLRKAYGYKELADKMSIVYNTRMAKGPLFYSARHYQAASLLAFYLPGQPDCYVMLDSDAMKNYRFWDSYRTFTGRNCVFAWSEDWELWETSKLFNRNEYVEKVILTHNKEEIKEFNINFLEGLK